MKRRLFLVALGGLPLLRSGGVGATDAGSADEPKVEFAPVLPGRPLTFPADHGAHPAFRTEWWYATGWLRLPDGSPLGFQITFFRVRTGVGEGNPSAFAPRQLILAHAAIADPHLGRLRHEQRAARLGFGRAGFESGRTRVWCGGWRLEQSQERYWAEASGEGFAFGLTLIAEGPPLLQGEAGFSVKAGDPRYASYYYSRPQLRVEGTVTLDGRTQSVGGQGWLDHEWSSETMAPEAQGWDWVGVNLEDGGALMAFRMRSRDGESILSAATLRGSDGSVGVFRSDRVSFEPLRRWRSPRTGILYPVEWDLQIGERRLRLLPLMDDQELDSLSSTGAVYWEGAVRLSQAGREIGRGYLEMTGYGERLQVG